LTESNLALPEASAPSRDKMQSIRSGCEKVTNQPTPRYSGCTCLPIPHCLVKLEPSHACFNALEGSCLTALPPARRTDHHTRPHFPLFWSGRQPIASVYRLASLPLQRTTPCSLRQFCGQGLPDDELARVGLQQRDSLPTSRGHRSSKIYPSSFLLLLLAPPTISLSLGAKRDLTPRVSPLTEGFPSNSFNPFVDCYSFNFLIPTDRPICGSRSF
jgi:hypothetical protein